MKKFAALVLALVLCLTAVSALAGVSEENFFQIETKAYTYARLTNDTDKTVRFKVNAEALDAAGAVIGTSTYFNGGCTELAPGQTSFVGVSVDVKDAAADSIKLTLDPVELDAEITQYPANVTLVINETIGWWVYNYAKVEITNTTEEMMVDPCATVAFMDDAGKILFVDDFELNGLSVHPGSTVTVRIDVNTSIVKDWQARGIEPTKGEAVIHVQK